MFNYCAFGLNISSEIKLPGLLEVISCDGDDVRIILGEVQFVITDEVHDSDFYVDHDDVYLCWKSIGKVKISNGKIVMVDVDSNIDEIIPLLLGPVMALLLHQRGFLVLHGSAVKINDGAVAFVGHRGIGKSTTAFNLYKKGYPLVTDDILAIKFDDNNIPYIYPGYFHLRLSLDTYNHVKDDTIILSTIHTMAGKVFCDASIGYSSKPVRLNRIYLLEEGVETKISSLKAQETLIDLISHSTASKIFKDSDHVINFTQCANLINNVIFQKLVFIHSFENISELIMIIENG